MPGSGHGFSVYTGHLDRKSQRSLFFFFYAGWSDGVRDGVGGCVCVCELWSVGRRSVVCGGMWGVWVCGVCVSGVGVGWGGRSVVCLGIWGVCRGEVCVCCVYLS